MLLHSFFIEDTSVLRVEEYHPGTGIEIYEVIRVVKRVPLFLEEHLRRFYHSAWLCHLEIPVQSGLIRSLLEKLIEVNMADEGNIRFSYTFRPSGRFRAYFIPHRYPDDQMVREGVACGLCHAERLGPNAKVMQHTLREKADRIMKENNYYEVILVNQQGCITEGSRSNLFFVKGNLFVTAPAEEVLPGITRQKVLDLLSANGYVIEQRTLSEDEMRSMDAAFLTGTSPKVLPVRRISNFMFSTSHPDVSWLMKTYDDLIREYIKNQLSR